MCASESFAYITRWIPAGERRATPRPRTPAPDADVYRQLTASEARAASGGGRLLTRGAVGLTVLSVAGWLWRQKRRHDLAPETGAPDGDGAAGGTASHRSHD
ncbi:MAG: hypothetical protein HOP14_14420 [Acidobacteria bacterium]|nr:hypothetical protein [Acidobacteriota bacterium]